MTKLEPMLQFFRGRATLGHFRMLAAIDDCGNLKNAAAALHVSAPAISKQLSELESALDQKVLLRGGGKLQFTEVGLLLLACARQMLAQLERTRVQMAEICSGTGGHIGIGSVPSVAPIMLPELVLELRKAAPSASIRLAESRFDHLAQALENSSLDVVIARYTEHEAPMNFLEEVLFLDPLVIVMGRQYAAGAAQSSSWRNISGIPWVLPPRGSDTFAQLAELLHHHELDIPAGCVESVSFSATATLLQKYPFVALMPLAYVRPYLQSNALTRLPLVTGGIREEIKAVWRSDNRNAVIPVLLDCIRKVAQLQAHSIKPRP